MKIITVYCLAIFILLSNPALWGQEGFNADLWDILAGKTDTVDGRIAFTGTALLKDTKFGEGTIEWDLWSEGGRSYAGVIFHYQDNRNSEEFYVRPHKANGLNADAFQYTPVYHGVSCWQLYHGKGNTGSAHMPYKEWVHFKLMVKDDRAIVQMGSGEPQTLMIDDLQTGATSGRLGVKGPADGSSWFSNFRWTPSVDEEFPEKGPEHSPDPGIICKWEVSQPFSHNEVDPYSYYDGIEEIEWEELSADKNGLLNLTQHKVRNPMQPGWVYARASVRSDKDGLHRYMLGYSDYVTVFVNGVPLMSSTNAYTSRDPGFAGLTGYFDEVFLPLKKGENEICLLVGEQFGGWGLMMKDAEKVHMADGISKVWEIKHRLNYPESAVYDKSTGNIYVSNYLSEKGGYISVISADGDIINRELVTGLRQPTGITLSGNKIYLVERTNVVEIEKESGEILTRYPIPDCSFPNDIASDDKGKLYITDNEANRIYRYAGGEISIFMQGGEINRPNGIDYCDNSLYVGCSGDASIKRIDMGTGNIVTLAVLPAGSIMDGLQVIEQGEILFSDFTGHLFRLDKSGKVTELINTATSGVNLADFEYIQEREMLVIPGLYSNYLVAYSLQSN
jgi:hypothetical protein